MSRYINYDALDYKNWNMIGKSSDFIDGVVYMGQRIEEAPSIDIVFCKECRYFIDNLTEDDTDEAYDACRWDWKRQMPRPDDFCSYGERKESE